MTKILESDTIQRHVGLTEAVGTPLTEVPLVNSITFNKKREIKIHDPEAELQFTPFQRFMGRIKHTVSIGDPLRDLRRYFIRRIS